MTNPPSENKPSLKLVFKPSEARYKRKSVVSDSNPEALEEELKKKQKEEEFLKKHPQTKHQIIDPNTPADGSYPVVKPPSEMEDEDNQVPFNPPTPMTRRNTLDEFIDSDLEAVNNTLLMLHAGWEKVRSITSLCKLADSTVTLLQKRRQLALHPDAASNNAAQKNLSLPTD